MTGLGLLDRARATRICFLYIAQPHQVWHSLSTAVALARGWPGIQVEIAATSAGHLDYIQGMLDGLGGAPVTLRLLPPAWLRKLSKNAPPPKALMLALNAARLSTYDAVVTPERTTALLRKLGVRRTALVYTQHGAGDRGGPFEPRLRAFDLVMAAGPKQRDRMVDEGWVKPEACAMVGYPKFDLVDALPPSAVPAFEKPLPTVVYNPHFHETLGSWPAFGLSILEQFAADERFNLVFAPHVRLFETASEANHRAVARFAGHPRIHIDLGGPAAFDMTYTRSADLYLGDASSQVYEFLRTPKPCLFLNPAHADWKGDESFHHWRYGPVLETADNICDATAAAFAGHGDYLDAQTTGVAETFDLTDEASSLRAARAIVDRLAALDR
ncbi:glycerophosphotransferase [Caulobacter sp. D4A]|uniref:glycerophosphotransferase n=1 Tax=unclassified Caulobacter TaxID=2648921 RepID=UPI000D73762D|nr:MULTISPECIES: glycerophosphotransferase [unclassified Caulobacter]PXA93202.1 glycerophosphotransferase [Caulobacter sp. D5]PXA93710.1 glycerophosphotransferase [Caulobacter sp. D4A]